MIRFIVLFTLGFSLQAGAVVSFSNDCSSSNIGTSYSTSSPGLPANFTAFPVHFGMSISVINGSTTRICVNVSTLSSSSAPSSGNNEFCVPSLAFGFFDMAFPDIKYVQGKGNVYIRADGSSCTTGLVDIAVW